ncbi:hypothetical protein GPJ81_10545 [Pseudomonas alkylphenolica]|jgi:hypothetical protein|uniref:Uncharacterized protein n=1 Tax=Pseudomonas alkylphenolica TaxID=237609 RepID=A0A6I6H8Y3_9PSED|nr:hypothetical protein [Pseudomonas alkylphenolica]QGW77098.1 hypothetical protein GPJ81_10545 [Pseudomonas alkylphenolica]
MFAAEAESFFSRILATWFFFTMFAFFAAALLPGLLTVPAVIACMGLTYWCVDCAYRTERFGRFAAFRLFSILGLAPVIGFVCALMTASKELKLGPLLSVAFGCIPVIIAVVAYLAVYQWCGQHNDLVVRGQRVEVAEVAPRRGSTVMLSGLAAGLSSMIYPMVKSHNISTVALVLAVVALSLFVIFYYRNNIAAFRELKERETRERCHYTFMNVEEIRERRVASLLGRIFAVRTRR